jgi:hypothetical protein
MTADEGAIADCDPVQNGLRQTGDTTGLPLGRAAMDPFFFVTLPDGTKQRLMRFDTVSALPAVLTDLLGMSAQLDLIRLPVGSNRRLQRQRYEIPDAGASVEVPDLE